MYSLLPQIKNYQIPKQLWYSVVLQACQKFCCVWLELVWYECLWHSGICMSLNGELWHCTALVAYIYIFFLTGLTNHMICRPRWSQGLIYKHLCDWLIHSLSEPLVKISLRRRHARTVKNGDSSHKTNYIEVFSEILNPEGHKNCYIGSKVTAILLNGLILPTGWVSSGRVKKKLHTNLMLNDYKVFQNSACIGSLFT